jgi:hypothetical protein
MLRSRFTLAAIALALLACLSAVEAQQAGKVARVGFLYFGSREPGPGAARYATFLEGLRDLGYVEGKDLIVEPNSTFDQTAGSHSLATAGQRGR